jgi:hypothetical protein
LGKVASNWLLKASWGPRKEDSGASARNLLAYLNSLSQLDATMTTWCRTQSVRHWLMSESSWRSKSWLLSLPLASIEPMLVGSYPNLAGDLHVELR